jgi:hypothetical protein
LPIGICHREINVPPTKAGGKANVNDLLLLMDARIGRACESDLNSLNLFNSQAVPRPVVDPSGGRTFEPGKTTISFGEQIECAAVITRGEVILAGFGGGNINFTMADSNRQAEALWSKQEFGTAIESASKTHPISGAANFLTAFPRPVRTAAIALGP